MKHWLYFFSQVSTCPPIHLHFIFAILQFDIGDHPFKTSANFHNFYPYPLPSAFHQNAYEGDFWSVCTVTFWPSAHGDTSPPKTCWRLKWMVPIEFVSKWEKTREANNLYFPYSLHTVHIFILKSSRVSRHYQSFCTCNKSLFTSL